MFDTIVSVWSNIRPSPTRQITNVSSTLNSPIMRHGDVLSNRDVTKELLVAEEHVDLFYKPKTKQMPITQGSSISVTMRASPAIGHVPPRFPIKQLASRQKKHVSPPIAIFYGGSDTLPDMKALLHGIQFYDLDVEAATQQLVEEYQHVVDDVDASKGTAAKNKNGRSDLTVGKVLYENRSKANGGALASPKVHLSNRDSPLAYLKCIPPYEHLCLLWADSLREEVIPDVLRCLEQHCR